MEAWQRERCKSAGSTSTAPRTCATSAGSRSTAAAGPRAGVMLRSDNLQGLTARDVARLVDDLGLRVVIDLRTGAEVELEGPGPLVRDGRVEVRHRSLYPESGDADRRRGREVLPWQPGRRSTATTRRARPSAPTSATCATGPTRSSPRCATSPTATAPRSCTARRARTAPASSCALALATVGVPREAIVADYVATGDRLGPLLARLRSSPTYAEDIATGPDDSHRPRPETMRRFLAVLDERHGGAPAWLEAHGFGPDDAAALRARSSPEPAAFGQRAAGGTSRPRPRTGRPPRAPSAGGAARSTAGRGRASCPAGAPSPAGSDAVRTRRRSSGRRSAAASPRSRRRTCTRRYRCARPGCPAAGRGRRPRSSGAARARLSRRAGCGAGGPRRSRRTSPSARPRGR